MTRKLLIGFAVLLAAGMMVATPAAASAEVRTLVSNEETGLCVDPAGFTAGVLGSPDYAPLEAEHEGAFPDTGSACSAGFPEHAIARTGSGHPGQEGGPGNRAFPYAGSIPDASWVSVDAAGEDYFNAPPAYYIYSTTFELCGNQLEGAQLQGEMLADDVAAAFLNGVPIGHQPWPNSHELGYPNENGAPTAFSYGSPAGRSAGFRAGINTLQIVVLDEAPSLTGVDFSAAVTPSRECQHEEQHEREGGAQQEGKTPPLQLPTAPHASLQLATPNPKAGQELTLSGAGSSAGSGHIVSYNWSFNGSTNDSTSTGTNPNAEVIFKPGYHTVGVTVTNSDGLKDTATVGVVVPSEPLPECEPEATYRQGDVEIIAECIHKVAPGEYTLRSKQLQLNGMVLLPLAGGTQTFTIKPVIVGSTAIAELSGPAVNIALLNTPAGNLVLGGYDLQSEPIQLSSERLNLKGIGPSSGKKLTSAAHLRAHVAGEEANTKTLLFAFGVGTQKCSAEEAAKKVGCCPPASQSACAELPGGFPVTGTVAVYVNSKMQAVFVIQVGVTLKEILEATGTVELVATSTGIELNSLKFAIPEAGFKEVFEVKEVTFSYYWPSDTEVEEEKRGAWEAKGKLVFGPEKPPPELELELAFSKHGNFKSGAISLGAGKNGIPVFPGVELNKLGAGLGVEPFYFQGKLGALIAKVLELTVEFRFHEETASEEGFFGLQGSLEYEEHKLGTIAFDLWFRGYMDGKIEFNLKLPEASQNPTVVLAGGVQFWDETASGRWEAEGALQLKLWELNAEVAALVNNSYIAGCGSIAGFGGEANYDFHTEQVNGSLFLGKNCSEELKPFKEQALVKHEGGFVKEESPAFPGALARASSSSPTRTLSPSSQATQAAGSSDSFTLRAGTRGEELRISSTSGTPVATLTGPGGQSFTTPSTPGKAMSQPGRYISAVAPNPHQVLVLLSNPQGGTWQMQAAPGSAPIAKLETAELLAPASVAVHLRRGHSRGHGWALSYEIHRRLPGTSVSFVERGADSSHLLGRTDRASGELSFTPRDAPSRSRTIWAYLDNSEGVPVRRIAVARFTAPPAVRGGRPRHVRIARHGALSALLTWGATPGARAYRIKVRGTDGRLQTFLRAPGSRSVTLTNVLPFESFTATVRAIGGPDLLAGRPATVKLAAARHGERTAKSRPLQKKRKHKR